MQDKAEIGELTQKQIAFLRAYATTKKIEDVADAMGCSVMVAEYEIMQLLPWVQRVFWKHYPGTAQLHEKKRFGVNTKLARAYVYHVLDILGKLEPEISPEYDLDSY